METKKCVRNKLGDVIPTISIIPLNVNGLNNPIKSQIVKLDSKTQLFLVYRRHIFEIQRQID